MADTYKITYTLKDASTGKTKTITLNNVAPKVFTDQQSNPNSVAALSVKSFGINYAAAVNSTTTLVKARTFKTSELTSFDVEG